MDMNRRTCLNSYDCVPLKIHLRNAGIELSGHEVDFERGVFQRYSQGMKQDLDGPVSSRMLLEHGSSLLNG